MRLETGRGHLGIYQPSFLTAVYCIAAPSGEGGLAIPCTKLWLLTGYYVGGEGEFPPPAAAH